MEIFETFSNLDFFLFGSFPNGQPGGLFMNVILAVFSLSLSFIFGVFLGYSRLSSRLYVKLPCIAYIEIVRALPLIIIIFWFYFVMPSLFGIFISVFWSVLISLSLYAAAYQAEIVRSGITSVPKSQLDIALATGMTRYRAMGYVVLPQAFRMMLPSFISFFITLFKDSSTVLLVGVIELTQAGVIISQRQPDKMFPAYFTVALGFFLVSNGLALIVEKLEKRIGIFDFLSYRPDVSRDEFMLFPRYKLQPHPQPSSRSEKKKQKKYAMLIDLNRCIGCHACQVTCKAEHNVAFGIFRCSIETHYSGRYPQIKKIFIPRLCNQCEKPPCIDACDEKDAIVKEADGVVLIDSEKCPKEIRCEKCYELCPYKAIDLNPYTNKPEKCDFCYDRIQNDELPVCVTSCMGKAIVFGDMNDKKSPISQKLKRRQIKVLNPEHDTHPLVFYLANDNIGKQSPLKNYEIPKKLPIRPPGKKKAVQSSTHPAKTDAEYVHSACSMCPSECGIVVRAEKGVAKKIYGNPHTLISNGTLCSKGAAGLQLTYSPHRIKMPLLRTGKRGEDKWKEITWDEASDMLARKLIAIKNQYGAESVFLNTGDMTDSVAYERLFRAFGTPNILNHGCVCDPNRQWGSKLMCGDARPLPDVQRPLLMRDKKNNVTHKTRHDAKLILNIGTNPFVATRFNYMSNGIPGARVENNCKYIVIDPSHTHSAAHADIWHPIIPGTDAALLAAMLFYIINNDSSKLSSRRYIDHEFLEKYTTGWEIFKKAFLSLTKRRDPLNKLFYFTLDWAAEKTGISHRDIEKIAHLFGNTKPASIEIGMHGTAHHTNGDVSSILMAALCLITGNMDIPGGLVFISSQKPQKSSRTAGFSFLIQQVKRMINSAEVSGHISDLHKDHFGSYPTAARGVLVDLPEKIRNGISIKHGPFRGYHYPVKAYIVRAGNPVISAGSTPDWIDALTSTDENGEYNVELMACIDTHVTVTGRYADIIFPEAGYLEHMGLNNVFTMSPEVALRDQVIKPLHESRTPFEFMMCMSEAFIRNGDPDVRSQDFLEKYTNEHDFINELLIDSPGFYNVGTPLPYPDLPEGCRIIGTPDNPVALMDGEIVKEGEYLTVEWLRSHNGVAVWPASYLRYRKSDGSPSGKYPRTESKKFEFTFRQVEKINRKFGTAFPTTFYWTDCKWNPQNPEFREISKSYPFQLISGRVHHSMTMTVLCPYLSEISTECMEPLNDDFTYRMPGLNGVPNTFGLLENEETVFKAGRISIPVFAINRTDGENLRLWSGDIVEIENPQKKRIRGKVVLTEEVMPGVIKVPFGPGGQKASGLGFMNNTYSYTPNINELYDPQNFNHLTGTPGFGDIMVKIIKVTSD